MFFIGSKVNREFVIYVCIGNPFVYVRELHCNYLHIILFVIFLTSFSRNCIGPLLGISIIKCYLSFW